MLLEKSAPSLGAGGPRPRTHTQTETQTQKAPPKQLHISKQPMTWSNWYQHIHWIHCSAAVILPAIGVALATRTPLSWATAAFTFFYLSLTAMGITAGYHRLWSHRSYKASGPLRVFLACMGGSATEHCIRVWATEHRAHHRYIDTEKDPYSAHKGLWYSHMGWLIFKQDPKRIGRVDISDLNEDPVVRWQQKYYEPIVVFFSMILPSVICGLGWNDYWGGFVYAGLVRVFIVQQATFCINSLAHWMGDQPFDDKHTPRSHWLLHVITYGEGNHNFHHEFPADYRTGIDWWNYEPTKWFILTMKYLGLASDLKQFNSNAIEIGRYKQAQKKLNQQATSLDFGIPVDQLPVMSWDQFKEETNAGRALVCISGVIHDVGDFIADHPGGRAIIKAGIGKDATAMFNGGVYDHSNAAHHTLSTMRIAALRGGMEVEVWKASNNVD